MKKIAILASGSGTNAENIVRLFHEGNKIRVVVVLANRQKAGVHERMQALGVPTQYVPNSVWENDAQQVVDILQRNEVDLVVLAGFMRKIDSAIINAYRGRIINIHPSLLPAHGGKGMYGHYVHEAVIAAGDKQSGVTVHYVTDEIDGGEIIMQQAIDLVEGETAESLEAKIHPVEYDLYPRAIVAALKKIDEQTPSAPTSIVDLEEESAFGSYAMAVDDIDNEKKNATPEEEWANELSIKYDPQPQAATPPPTPEVDAAPQQPTQPYASQPQPSQQPLNPIGEQEPMPSTHLVWSVIMTLCCCMVPGIVAIFYSAQVSSRYHNGDIEGAKRASKAAEAWIIASFVLGLLSTTLQLPIMLSKELLLSSF